MSDRTPPQMATEEVTEEQIADRLYGLPSAEFTKARNEAASGLRSAGQRAAADLVKALAKPTAAAAAVNRLVREHRGDVAAFLRAAAALRDAQFAGKGDLAAATRQERDELERLVVTGGEAVRQTLLAAAADDDAARRLLEARLVRELELQGFGTLLAHADPTAMKRAGSPPAQPSEALPQRAAKAGDAAAPAQRDAARAALAAAEAAEADARTLWERAQRRLADSRAAAERARTAAEKAWVAAEEAGYRVEKAQSVAEEAKRGVETAQAAADQARRELDRLRSR